MTQAYRRLLLPEGGVWVDTRHWELKELPQPVGAALIWGEVRMAGTASLQAAVRRIIAREAAVAALRVRARRNHGHLGVTRLANDDPGEASLRRRLRRRLRRGTLVQLSSSPHVSRPLDDMLERCDLRAVGPPLVGAGGGVLQRVRRADGTPGMLRLGVRHDSSDPSHAAAALLRLESCGRFPAPRLLDQGTCGELQWSVESLVPGSGDTGRGHRPWSELAAAWTALPRSDGPSRATGEDLRRLAGMLPDRSEEIVGLVSDVESATRDVHGVMVHRDLWPGNVLAQQGRLTGVIDWGAWRGDGLPGVDLLQLYANRQRRRRREHLAAAWLRRPWEEPAFRAAMRPYWATVGLEPQVEYFDVLGLAWWAAEVAGTIERIPGRRDDPSWRAVAVDPVLNALTASSPLRS